MSTSRKNQIIYNSKQFSDRKKLAYVHALKSDFLEKDIAHESMTQTQLKNLADNLEVPLSRLFDTKNAIECGISEPHNLDELSKLKVMQKIPQTIQTPILIKDDKYLLVDDIGDIIRLEQGN
ncbi:hypothetical protein R9C00_05115 [Flammeovirgaceae bacterium SG7u.111]|nr:hypothetical protein [Flammeovirgaceae bacterium SG7u.132]WPO36825.1 hypothetical protein R9C00_05115 [Flammeovirgaceae bacterium SG7u.111]